MQTKPKSNSTITHSMQDGKIVFTVLGAGNLTFDPDRVSAENRARAMIHGFVQRISDGGALSRNPETGKPATAHDKLARMQRIAEHLMSGTTEWNLRTAAPKGLDVGLVIMAMIRALSGVASVDDAEAVFAKTVKAGRAADRDEAIKVWAKSRQVAEAMKAIELERAAANATEDSDDLLNEIMGEDESDESGESGE